MQILTDQRGRRTLVIAVYGSVVLALVILAIVNYPIQWRDQVNKERHRYLEVIAQAIVYYTLDHDGVAPDLPATPMMIANRSDCSLDCPALGRTLACYDLNKVLVPGYVKEIPQDPLLISDVNSGFYLSYQGKVLTLGACSTFFNQNVSLSKSL